MSLNYEDFCHPGIEKSVLSCLIKKPNLIISSKFEISKKFFLSPYASELFVCIDNLFNKKIESFTLDVLHNEAQNIHNLRYINTQDGYEYIKAVFDAETSLDLYSYYVNELVERHNKYNLCKIANTFQNKVLANLDSARGSLSFDDLVSNLESNVFTLSSENTKSSEAVDLAEYAKGFFERLKEPAVEILGVRSGMQALDSITNGFKRGSLYVIAARAKQGKSTTQLSWGTHVAYKENLPVLYIDTEMNTELQMNRLVSHLTKIKIRDLENKTYSRDSVTLDVIEIANEIISSGKFKHKSMPRFNKELIRFEIKKFIRQEGDGIVFFDYIKLPDVDLGTASETQHIGYLTTELKSLANELNIPIITAVQFNREAVGKRASSHFISGSDRVLHYADMIMAQRKLTIEEMAYYRTKIGYGSLVNGILEILDSRSTESGRAVLLDMDLERASVKEALSESIDSYEFEPKEAA